MIKLYKVAIMVAILSLILKIDISAYFKFFFNIKYITYAILSKNGRSAAQRVKQVVFAFAINFKKN